LDLQIWVWSKIAALIIGLALNLPVNVMNIWEEQAKWQDQFVVVAPTPAPVVREPVYYVPQSTPTYIPSPKPIPTYVPTIIPTVVSAPSSGGSLSQWVDSSNWPSGLHGTVERVAMCESSGNPGAVGGGLYQGLMQVNPNYHGAVPSDPVAQLNQAYEVYLKQGWGAWSCY